MSMGLFAGSYELRLCCESWSADAASPLAWLQVYRPQLRLTSLFVCSRGTSVFRGSSPASTRGAADDHGVEHCGTSPASTRAVPDDQGVEHCGSSPASTRAVADDQGAEHCGSSPASTQAVLDEQLMLVHGVENEK
jgi:hypothetical protein